jgi:hypothetical protein
MTPEDEKKFLDHEVMSVVCVSGPDVTENPTFGWTDVG